MRSSVLKCLRSFNDLIDSHLETYNADDKGKVWTTATAGDKINAQIRRYRCKNRWTTAGKMGPDG